MPYPAHVREQAVWLVVQSGRSVREVSAELSIAPQTVRRWVRLRAQQSSDSPFEDSPSRPVDHTGLNGSAAASGTAEQLSLLPTVRETAGRVVTSPSPRGATRRVPVSYLASAYLAVTACWGLSIALAALLNPSGALQRAAAAVHVLSLVVGFGAVVLVDWHGLLWLLRRRSLHDCAGVAATARPLIWAGTAGLLLSGALLRPDLADRMIWVKLVAVLVILLNAVAVGGLAADLQAANGHAVGVRPPARLRRRLLASGALSAAAWWTAIIIGLITNAHRH